VVYVTDKKTGIITLLHAKGMTEVKYHRFLDSEWLTRLYFKLLLYKKNPLLQSKLINKSGGIREYRI